MLRITLAACAVYLSTFNLFSQVDSSAYKNRKLKFEEVNFVSSYYRQEGDNSAVTGGIGSEHLTDFASTIEVKVSRYDRKNRLNTFSTELGFDVYTSASSDKIDPTTVSSASSQDRRFYPSLTWAIANEKKRSTVSYGLSVSTEYDYFSKGISVGWSKLSKDRNRELSARLQAFLDTWSVILPIELRNSVETRSTTPRNSYSASLTLSQVVTARMQVLLLADVALQHGELATLYHRTYFTDGTHTVEHLPDKRWKIPLGVRLNYFLGDRYIFRSYYRYYQDDWGLRGHTFELESPVKINPFVSISPFYRYYKQNGIRYFQGYRKHDPEEKFYSSDYDLSDLHSNMAGIGFRFAPPSGVMGVSTFNAVEVRYGRYVRSTGLTSDIITIFAKFK